MAFKKTVVGIFLALSLLTVWKMEFLNFISAVILGLSSLWLVNMMSTGNSRLNRIPGPIGWPLLGNLPQLRKGNLHLELTKLAKIHGPVFKIKLASRTAVVVNDYNSIYEVLVAKGKDFAGRPFSWRRLYGFGGHLGISGSDPTEEWKVGRKVLHNSLKAFGTGMNRIEKLALEMSKELMDDFHQTNGSPVDPEPIIYSATIKMISLMIFGRKFEKDSESYIYMKGAVEDVVEGLSNNLSGSLLETFPLLRHFGNTSFRHLRKGLKSMSFLWEKEVLDKLSDWNLENIQPDQSLSVSQALFDYENKSTKESMQVNDLFKKSLCLQTACAGIGTTTCSMLSLLIILVHHPRVQTKIQEEIDAVLGHNTIGLDHQAFLPFTKATLYELHRYLSVVPINLPHKTLNDTTIGDFMVPKNTMILANFWSLHHDGELWKDPYKFWPERFLDSSGHLIPADHSNRKHLMAFSAGPRVCPGETLGQARLFLWTVSIMQSFTLKAEGESPNVSCDPRTYIPLFGLKPQSYQLRFLPRTTQSDSPT